MGSLSSRRGLVQVNEQTELKFGRFARDAALARLSSTVSRQEWLAKARACAVDYARRHGSVTSDHVRHLCPIPTQFDPRILGAVFKCDDLVAVGFTHTKRREGHARIIRVWRALR